MASLKLIAFGALLLYFLSLIPAQAQECNEFWICTDWSFCTGTGMQIRTCKDLNSCGTEKLKPPEMQECVPIAVRDIVAPQEQSADTGITGLLLSNTPAMLGILTMILLAAAYITYRKWKDIRMFVSSP